MARKKEPKMPVTATEKKPIRLELPTADYKRLERQARKLDRSLSYVARLACMEWIKAREVARDLAEEQRKAQAPAAPTRSPLPGQRSFIEPGKGRKGGAK